MNAERAWAAGMQRQQETITNRENARPKHHSVRRFKKASKFAQKLDGIISVVSDSLTQVESEAYTHYILGTYYLEKKKFAQAWLDLEIARTTYTLLKQTIKEREEVYAQMEKEIEVMMRLTGPKASEEAPKEQLRESEQRVKERLSHVSQEREERRKLEEEQKKEKQRRVKEKRAIIKKKKETQPVAKAESEEEKKKERRRRKEESG